MADSNITKKALANALISLMSEVSFEKINVASICEKCNMNRKSFYYHFKDKYDLVNWIFDNEFISLLSIEDFSQISYTERLEFLDHMLETFYDNRNFYREALKIKGQNSFSDHFRECLYPILKQRIELAIDTDIPNPFAVNFISDAFICALERWLSEKDCMPPDQFGALLKNIIFNFAVSISEEMKTASIEVQ